MTVEVFWGSGSPFAWSILLAFEVKGVPYESRLLSFSEGDLKTPEFLALNPRGRIPTIRDGSFVLYESLAILAWLDRKHPEPPLFGATAEEAGLVWRLISEHNAYVAPLADRIIGPVFAQKVAKAGADMRQAAPEIQAELRRLDATLAGRSWLVGERVSAADIVVHAQLEFFLRIAGRGEVAALSLGFDRVAKEMPALQAWRERMAGLPGYDRAYPPHWKAA